MAFDCIGMPVEMDIDTAMMRGNVPPVVRVRINDAHRPRTGRRDRLGERSADDQARQSASRSRAPVEAPPPRGARRQTHDA